MITRKTDNKSTALKKQSSALNLKVDHRPHDQQHLDAHLVEVSRGFRGRPPLWYLLPLSRLNSING